MFLKIICKIISVLSVVLGGVECSALAQPAPDRTADWHTNFYRP